MTNYGVIERFNGVIHGDIIANSPSQACCIVDERLNGPAERYYDEYVPNEKTN